MIYYVLALGIGWICLAAIASMAMLTTVALTAGIKDALRTATTELPTIIGLAVPGFLMVLLAAVSLTLSGRTQKRR